MLAAEVIEISDDEAVDEAILPARDELLDMVCPPAPQPLTVRMETICSDMRGTEEEKEQILHTRIQKYFWPVQSIDLQSQCVDPRMEPRIDEELHPTMMIVYGADFLSKRILAQRMPGAEIKALNMSNWRIEFMDSAHVKAALEINLQDSSFMADKMESEDMIFGYGWFTLKPYYKNGFERKLEMRHATLSECCQEFCERRKKDLILEKASKIYQTRLPQQGLGPLNDKSQSGYRTDYEDNLSVFDRDNQTNFLSRNHYSYMEYTRQQEEREAAKNSNAIIIDLTETDTLVQGSQQ